MSKPKKVVIVGDSLKLKIGTTFPEKRITLVVCTAKNFMHNNGCSNECFKSDKGLVLVIRSALTTWSIVMAG